MFDQNFDLINQNQSEREITSFKAKDAFRVRIQPLDELVSCKKKYNVLCLTVPFATQS